MLGRARAGRSSIACGGFAGLPDSRADGRCRAECTSLWAFPGFYGSVGPSLIDQLVGCSSLIERGLVPEHSRRVASLTTYVIRRSRHRE